MSSQFSLSFWSYVSLLNSFVQSENSQSIVCESERSSMGVIPSAQMDFSREQEPEWSEKKTSGFSCLEDENQTPKTRSKNNLLKSGRPSLKRTHSSMTEKVGGYRKSMLHSIFSIEDLLLANPEADSAETDFNSPVPSSNKSSAPAPQQQQLRQPPTYISQFNQVGNTQSHKTFFQEFEEIASALFLDTSKKIKLEDISLPPFDLSRSLFSDPLFDLSHPLSNISENSSQSRINQNKFNQKAITKLNSQALPKEQNHQSQAHHFDIQDSKYFFPIQHKTILISQQQQQPKLQQPPRKMPAKAVFAEEVYLKSISHEGSIKLQKFPCFKEFDLQIPNEYSQLIQQFSDGDKCSEDELLAKAVNYMHKKLVASTMEQNPFAQIPDAEKNFQINDLKIDRESEEEEEDFCPDKHPNQYSTNSLKYRQTNFLSDDEEDDDDDDDDQNINSNEDGEQID